MSDAGSEAAAPQTTTVSGATPMSVSPWMTAAVVAAYATKAIWVKLRSAARKQKQLKTCQGEPSLEEEDGNYLEAEDELEVAPVEDEMLKHIQSEAGPMIKL